MSKITLETIKKFIRDNKDNLYISNRSSFDGSQDMVTERSGEWHKAEQDTIHPKYTLGVSGAWFVGRSRDYFQAIDNGYSVINACGAFQLRKGA